MCEGVEDIVVVGGGGVFAFRTHVADGGEGAGEKGGVEEDAGAGGAFAFEEGDAEEELGLEAADGGKGEVGEAGLEGEGGYVSVGAGWLWVSGVLGIYTVRLCMLTSLIGWSWRYCADRARPSNHSVSVWLRQFWMFWAL